MRVLDIATRTVLDVEACYGARLIGQGRAVLAPAEPAEPTEPAKEPEPEKPEVTEAPKAEEVPKSKAKKKG